MDHSEEVGGELVVAGCNAAEVLQLGEEPLDQITLAVEAIAKAGLPAPVALGWYIGRGTLVVYQFADAVGIVSLVRQHDHARPKMIEQSVSDLPVMGLSSR